MPEPKDLHIDQLLSNFSVQYKNETHLWRDVLPVVGVNKRSDKFVKYNKPDTYRVADDRVGVKGLPNEIDWTISTDNYSVKDHALADWMAQEEAENADTPISAEIDTIENINRGLDLAQENRAAALLFAAANYPTGNKVQLSGTSQWSGTADAPIVDVQTAVETCFMRANTLVFGLDAWLVFRRLPEIVEAIRSVAPQSNAASSGMVSSPEVASLFEVERVLIGRARKNTAKQGQTATYARVWGKHMAALHLAPGTVGIKTNTFAKTFVEQDRLSFREFDGKRGVKGAHFFKVAWNSDEKIVSSDLGYFIEDAVA
jgi:hypothetical protein